MVHLSSDHNNRRVDRSSFRGSWLIIWVKFCFISAVKSFTLSGSTLLLHHAWIISEFARMGKIINTRPVRTYFCTRLKMEYLSLAQFSELKSMWCTHFGWWTHFGSAWCDACIARGELCSLFFYWTVNSFPTVNSLPTVNSVKHALVSSTPPPPLPSLELNPMGRFCPPPPPGLARPNWASSDLQAL